MFTFWQPLGGEVWTVTDPTLRGVIWGVFAFGWLLVLVSTFLINHFDLFGLRQVWLQLVGRRYTYLKFGTPGPYKLVRHPLYLGWLFAFWATPTMTGTHLLFAFVTTAYILVAIQLEEQDLVDSLGEDYRRYRERVPMILPLGRARGGRQRPRLRRVETGAEGAGQGRPRAGRFCEALRAGRSLRRGAAGRPTQAVP